MQIKYRIALFLNICLGLSLVSQELPPINNYKISDYKAGNQNWSISQANNKYIYVGNNDGLLEFNGDNCSLDAV